MKLVSPKSKVYDAIASPASGSEEPEPSKFTVNGAEPESGAALNTAVGGVCGRQKLLPTSVYEGVLDVLSVAVDPVTLTLPVPLNVRGLMFAKVEPRFGAPAPLKVLSAILLLEIVIVIVPSADIEPESAAPSGNGLLASGSGLVGESGGPTWPYS